MVSVTRRVIRETAAGIYSAGYRNVILELEPPGRVVGFRLKGTRRTYHLSVEFCFREALRQELAARKAAKLKARKEAGRG